MNLRAFVLALTSVVLLAPPAAAEDPPGTWRSHGPSTGGALQLVASHPSGEGPIFAVRIPGSQGEGIYRSIDGGDTWEESVAGLPENFRPQSIVFQPGEPNIAYAAAATVYKTLNGGSTWFEATAGITGGFVNSLAIDPVDGDPIYAASSAGVFRSSNGGQSWARTADGLPSNAGARALAISPADPSRLYVAVLQSGASPPWRVYASVDAGSSWTPTTLSQGQFIYSLGVSATDPNVVYMGAEGAIKRTLDGGGAWTDVSSGVPSEEVRSFVVDSPSKVYAGTDGGLLSTVDAGGNWKPVQGLPPHAAYAVVRVGHDPSMLYVATCCGSGGVYRSADDGTTWISGTSGFPADVSVRGGLATSPSRTGVVYAGSYTGGSRSLYVSENSGRRWSGAGEALPASISSIAPHPTISGVALASAYSNGVYRTTDDGKTWTKTSLASGSIQHVTMAPSDPKIVYAGGATGTLIPPTTGIVHKSTDGGQTWTSSTTGFVSAASAVIDLAVHPTDPNVVYAAAAWGGLYKSLDGGQTWLNITPHMVNGIASSFTSIAIDPSDPSVAYVGVAGIGPQTGVYKTVLGGLAWVPTGLVNARVSSVIIDPVRPGTLYAAAPQESSRLVMRSTDGGTSWTPMVDGLDPTYGVYELAIDKDGGRLHGSTLGRGVFSVTIP